LHRRANSETMALVGMRIRGMSAYTAVVNGVRNAHIDFDEGEFELSGKHGKDIIVLDVGVIPMTEYQIAVDRVE